MQELLYRHLGKKSAKVEHVGAPILAYEKQYVNYFISPLKLVNDHYEVGIEIEVEKIRHNEIGEYGVWAAKEDNSLRDGGVEYVSVPIKGPRILFALNQFFQNLSTGSYHFSPRTSIHVHLNMLDCRPDQIAGLCLTYAPFEKLLFRFIGDDRDRNNFCVPLYEANCYDLFKKYTGEVPEFPHLAQHRYLALNLDAVRKFGTLEFRHLGGTDNKEKIIKWLNLIFRLKEYAVVNDWSMIHSRIMQLNTSSAYDSFFRDVFKEECRYLDGYSLQKDMESIVSSLKRMVILNPLRTALTNGTFKKHHWYNKLITTKAKPSNTMEFLAPQQLAPRPARNRARPEGPMPALRVREREEVDVAVQDGGLLFGVGEAVRAGVWAPMPPAAVQEEMRRMAAIYNPPPGDDWEDD